MAKRKTKRRRSPKTISVLNVLESITYASILSEGIAGTSVFGLFGATDLTQSSVYDQGLGTTTMGAWSGGGSLSLGDFVTEPAQALSIMQGNFSSNWKNMAVASFVTGLSFKWGRALLRRPINNINRNIMKNLGLGVRI